MPYLRLFISNHLEILAKNLSKLLRTPPANPLDKEIFIVQSRGMAHWISMQIARHNGICANAEFLFPNAFIDKFFINPLHDRPEQSLFDPMVMTWRLARILPQYINKPEFHSLRNYLDEDTTGLKLHQIAYRIADTFDQYLVFRPNMIFAWERGEDRSWQAVLFRALVRETDERHRASLVKDFILALRRHKRHPFNHESTWPIHTHDRDQHTRIKKIPENQDGNKDKGQTHIPLKNRQKLLPQRISIFGISALPRFHMELFAAMAAVVEVNLFLMNPCREYWGDIVDDNSAWTQTHSLNNPQKKQDIPDNAEHAFMNAPVDPGNSLLASMGKLGRDFFDMINEFSCEEHADFEDYSGNTLLSCLQSDILNLREGTSDTEKERQISPNDISIQVHSCHSPMREMEVLHDQLLNVLENNPDIEPKDILVMSPDIEKYVPFIEAVFGSNSDSSTYIPFSITDRAIKNTSETVKTFFRILELGTGHLNASEILEILEADAILHKFDLNRSDLKMISQWVKKSGIRWGINGKGRADMGLPAYEDNTWQAGLDRMLLGYAMPGKEEHIFKGIMPYDNIEGSDSAILGRFIEFTDRLFSHVHSFKELRSVVEWTKELGILIDDLFVVNEQTERYVRIIKNALNNLSETASAAKFHEPVGINVINLNIMRMIERDGFNAGFISRGITFCSMLPMRSIPFKMICLIGMDNEAYPRESQTPEFDLIAKAPKPGDRSRRKDDRYLFLETLLSAREILYISYIGQDIQDNSSVPPSVLVTELIDYINKNMPSHTVKKRLVTKHHLQAFNPEYFMDDTDLFSYSKENCKTARMFFEQKKEPCPFITNSVPVPDDEWKQLDINNLCLFFINPVRFLSEKRLGIFLEDDMEIIDTVEPIELNRLEEYKIRQRILNYRLKGYSHEDIFSFIRAMGLLPHGNAGKFIFNNLYTGMDNFIAKIKDLCSSPLDPLDIKLKTGDFSVTGRLSNIYQEHAMAYRYAEIRPEDRIKAWIHHLVLNTIKQKAYPLVSMLIGLSRKAHNRMVCIKFHPLEDAEEILKILLEIYWEGLIRPIHFFPRSSWAYYQEISKKNGKKNNALKKARTIWLGTDFSPGEQDNLYYKEYFRGKPPMDKNFERLSETVFWHLCNHSEEMIL